MTNDVCKHGGLALVNTTTGEVTCFNCNKIIKKPKGRAKKFSEMAKLLKND